MEPGLSDKGASDQPLRLCKAIRFWARLRGLHAWPSGWILEGQRGLCIAPCNAIHTVGMSHAIDVVFLDRHLTELKRREGVQPNRIAACPEAAMAIELPPGYCRRYPDYLQRIRLALASPPSADL